MDLTILCDLLRMVSENVTLWANRDQPTAAESPGKGVHSKIKTRWQVVKYDGRDFHRFFSQDGLRNTPPKVASI